MSGTSNADLVDTFARMVGRQFAEEIGRYLAGEIPTLSRVPYVAFM